MPIWLSKIPRPSARTVMLIVGLILFAVLAYAGPTACKNWMNERAQARLDKEQRGAATASGKDAIGTAVEAGKRETESEALTRTNEREIRAAPGANDPINPASGLAGRRALCRRAAYVNTPRCAMFRNPPR